MRIFFFLNLFNPRAQFIFHPTVHRCWWKITGLSQTSKFHNLTQLCCDAELGIFFVFQRSFRAVFLVVVKLSIKVKTCLRASFFWYKIVTTGSTLELHKYNKWEHEVSLSQCWLLIAMVAIITIRKSS